MDNLWQHLSERLRQPASELALAGLAVLIVTAGVWWFGVYLSPRGVFDGMLRRNLATSAVSVRQVSAEHNGIKVDKRSDLLFGPTNVVRIKATTRATATGTTVMTETAANTNTERNRYTSIRAGRDVPSLSTGDILHKWADGPSGAATAFTQTVLRPYSLPMAALPSDAQARLSEYLEDHEVFTTDYRVQRGHIDGRPTYTYEVRIQPSAYIGYLKMYATALGLKDLDEIDPAAARQTPPVAARLTVDARAHRLITADYVSLGYKETYTDYNVPRQLQLPAAQISAEQLQALVATLR